MSDRPIPPLESLLEHRTWVRAVARRLLRDEHAAEDLAQEAWVRVMRSPPDPERDPKPWLRRVLKNLASNRRRGEARRTKRETSWRPTPAQERRAERSPAELVAEAEQHKRLVNLVLDLEEPFKTVLVLRFYEGLGPKQIAERLEVPVGTVHSRIARATERLKERLDSQEHGDRTKWVAALLPLAGFERFAPAATAGAAATTSLAGVLLMTLTKPNVALVVLLLLGGLVGGALWLASDTSGDDHRGPSLLDASSDGGPELSTRGTLRASRDASAGDSGAATPRAPAQVVRGRVLDAEGKPVEGALIIALPAGSPGVDDSDLADLGVQPPRSSADGTFAFDGKDIPADANLLIHAPGRMATTISLAKHDRSALDIRLPAPWRVTVRVEDANGVWPAGTRVEVDSRGPDDFDHAADPRRQGTWRTIEPLEEDTQPERVVTVPSRAPMRATIWPPKGLAAVPPYSDFEHPQDTVAFQLVPSGRLQLRVVQDSTGKPLDDSARVSVSIGKRDRNVGAWSFGGIPREYDIDTRLSPGTYDVDIRVKGFARWQGTFTVREPGDAHAIVARLKPDSGTLHRGRLLLRIAASADAPEDVLAAARATGTPTKGLNLGRYLVLVRMTAGDLAAWRKVWGQRWADTHVRALDDGRQDVQLAYYTMQDPHVPVGTYDVYVAERATGRAALVRGVRVYGDQENEAEVRVEPGSFVRLAQLVDRTQTWKDLEVRAGAVAIPPVALNPQGYSTFTTAHNLRYLLDAPVRDIVLGPFPAAEVDVVVTGADDKQHTFRVRGTKVVKR